MGYFADATEYHRENFEQSRFGVVIRCALLFEIIGYYWTPLSNTLTVWVMFCHILTQVSWLPPQHPRAKITVSAEKLMATMKAAPKAEVTGKFIVHCFISSEVFYARTAQPVAPGPYNNSKCQSAF